MSSQKFHLVINAFALQDHNRFRAFGRYTYEFIKHVNDLVKEKSPVLGNIEQITILAAKSPAIEKNLDFELAIPVKTVQFLGTGRNILKYFFYKYVNFTTRKFFKFIQESGQESVYFLPRHQILTSPNADYTVTMVHDFIPQVFNTFHNNPIAAYFLKKEDAEYMKQLATTDLIITNSKDTSGQVKKYVPEATNIQDVYLASSLFEKYTDKVKAKKTPLAKRYFVYYGGFDFNKNLEGIIRAFGHFIRTHEDTNTTQLVLIGGQKKSEYLTKLAKAEGIHENIVLTGYVSDEELINYIVHSEGLFRLSLSEGFGLPELEVMSLGIPVISSRISCIEEMFGKFALLHNVDDIEAIATDLYNLVKHGLPHEKLTEAKMYAQSFTWRRTVEETIKAINSILDKNE